MSGNYQDWQEIIFTRKETQPTKCSDRTNNTFEDNPESFNVKRVSKSLAQQIQLGRHAKSMQQSVLARHVGVTQHLIKAYENGTAIPDNQVLQKIRKILNCKLNR